MGEMVTVGYAGVRQVRVRWLELGMWLVGRCG